MIKRIQFPQAPSGIIDANQRMQLGVGLIEATIPESVNTIVLNGSNQIVIDATSQNIIRKIN